MAQNWQNKGFQAFKFALPAADKGPGEELKALRKALGESALIACDMHWRRTRQEALSLIQEMAAYRPWYVEAPVLPEDIAGLAWVSQQANFSELPLGEEWRTVFDAQLRIDRQACHIIQPEMGHTGITQFMRIAQYAQAHHLAIIPHATIGSGIFLAASLQASASLQGVMYHEYQHSLFGHFRHYTGNKLSCESGVYTLPNGHGLGVEPSSDMKANMVLL